jgi:putative ABC transport system permease protein
MWRRIRRDPVLWATVTATLAVCIGANTAVFSIVDSVLLRPLPFEDPGRIYWITETFNRGQMSGAVSPDYYSLRDAHHLFAEVAEYTTLTRNWSGIERPEQLDVAEASPSFFKLLGVKPMIGRTFAEEEQGAKAPDAAVVSYVFWRNRLGSDPHALGRTLALDGRPYTVIGIMPQGFDYPSGTRVWQPIHLDRAEQLPRSMMRPMMLVSILGRLNPHLAPEGVDPALTGLARQIRAEYPKELESAGFLEGMSITATPLPRRITGDLRPALWALSGAVGLVLLIACANVANLLVARAAARQRELAVRMALGASSGRLTRDVLADSLLMAAPGGIVGALLAIASIWTLNTWKPLVLERYPAIAVDWRTLAFTVGITMLTGLFFGMAPALSVAGVRIQEALKAATGHSSSRGAARLRRVLVVAELALSLMLLIGAGLLARSFVNLARTPLGFPAENLLTVRANLTGTNYASAASQLRYYDDALGRIRQLPMVRDAAVTTSVPLDGDGPYQIGRFQVARHAPLPPAQQPHTDVAIASREYFAAMGIPLRRGRTFDASDTPSNPNNVVVNEAFARKIFGGEDPLRQGIVFGRGAAESTIIGVVGDTRGNSLGAEPEPMMYRCLCQQSGNRFLSRMKVVVRTAGDPRAAVRAVESAMYAADRTQPVSDIKTMEERVAAALAPQRFNLLLLGLFAAMAVVLASVGVYGVMAYLVTRRTREIGIRMAIGARPEQVQRQVMGETLWLAAAGVIAGIAGAWGLTRYLSSMLHDVGTLDPATFAAAALLLVTIAAAASLAPARRASRVDPVRALREE